MHLFCTANNNISMNSSTSSPDMQSTYDSMKKNRLENKYNYDLREYQLKSIGLLEAIDKVCREHGITYYLIAGTLLGAVRHKGFIPWDDDMDIALMRKDYDLLMSHAGHWVPAPYGIVDHENCSHYPKYFAKLENTDTTIVERLYLGYAGGIYMDIFPLDDVPDNRLLRALHFYRFNFARKLLYFAYRDPFKHGHGIRSWFPRLIQKIFTREQLHRHCQSVLREWNGKEGCNHVMTHDDGLCAYRKDIFGKPSTVEFEGVQACAPHDPEGFLVPYYGDYMTPPPVEKRVSHFHDYCDLNTPYRSFDINSLK